MLIDKLTEFFSTNFKGVFCAWETTQPNQYDVTSIDWCSISSWIILFGVFLLAAYFVLSKSRILDKLSKHILILSLSSITWILGVVIYIIGFYNDHVNGLSVVLRAIISSFKMFVVSHDLARIPPLLQHDATYMTAFSVVHFIAAFITFLFIFKMIGYKIKSSVNIFRMLWKAKDKEIHLFWGVNEASCLLAESIRRYHSHDIIAFVDIDKENDENTQKKATLSNITNTITIKSSEIARLDDIEALIDHCYGGPAALNNDTNTDIFGSLNLKNIGSIVEKCSKSFFYFLSENEIDNITGALNLQRDKRLCRGNDVIYIHARRDANNEVFDHYSQYDAKSKQVKMKIVDSAYLSVESLKRNTSNLPVNCVEVDYTTGTVNSPFTSMIVGFGDTGQEAFKFLYEFAAFIDKEREKSPFKCYAIDRKMNTIAGFIREKMPAIDEEELSLIQAEVDSIDFWTKTKSIINKLNYVVIALNNDDLGLSVAVNLFKYAIKNRKTNQLKLKILVRCNDCSNEKRMRKVIDNLNKSIDGINIEIKLFGTEKELYCYDTIINERTLQEAKEFHCIYENSKLSANDQWEKDFDNSNIPKLMAKKGISRYHAIYDINRRIAQNISNALHIHTKMILMGFYKNSKLFYKHTKLYRLKEYNEYATNREPMTTEYICDEDDKQLLLNIAIVEHERWIASQKLMGYTYNTENDYVKKYHKNMCAWNELDEETQSYDCNVVDTTIKMVYKEIKNIFDK